MKSFLVLTLLLGCLLEPIMAKFNMMKLARPGMTECLADHKTTPNALLDAFTRRDDDIDLHTKCALKCVLKHIGIVDNLGQLQVQEILKVIDDAAVRETLRGPLSACANEVGDTSCDAALLAVRCIQLNMASDAM